MRILTAAKILLILKLRITAIRRYMILTICKEVI
nr:MAG TPA: hypothetical protein [Caudoviricetes sp.]